MMSVGKGWTGELGRLRSDIQLPMPRRVFEVDRDEVFLSENGRLTACYRSDLSRLEHGSDLSKQDNKSRRRWRRHEEIDRPPKLQSIRSSCSP